MQEFDVVVIGGGPSGMAAALESDKSGAKTLIIEREDKLGGILNQCIHNGFGLHYFKEELTGPEYAKKFINLLEKSSVTVMLETFIESVDEKNKTLKILNCGGESVIKAKAIVLATGCRERTAAGIMLTGARVAGVYTAGQVQQMINIFGKLPCKNPVILGSGDIGLIMARRLTLVGAKVQGVYEIMKTSSGLARNVQQCLVDFNIKLHLQKTVAEVIGKDRVEAVVIYNVDDEMKIIENTKQVVKCDALILSCGLIPETGLIDNLQISNLTKGAVVDEYRQTSIDGIFSCGNVLHVHDLVDYVTVESLLAGKYASMYSLNKLEKSEKFDIKFDEKIRYCSPFSFYKNNDKLTLFFRLKQSIKKTFIKVYCKKNEVFKNYVLAAHGGEMQKIEIDKENINSSIEIVLEEV